MNRKLKLIAFCTILLLGFMVNCQEIDTSVDNKDRVEYYKIYDSITHYMHRDLKKAKKFALENLSFAKEKKNPKWIAKSTGNYGVVLTEIGGEKNLLEAERYLLDAVDQFSKLQDSTSIIFANNVLGSVYLRENEYPKALSLALKNIGLIKKSAKNKADSIVLGISYGNLGNIYKHIKLPDSSLTNYKRAIDVFTIYDHELQSPCLLGIADAYYSKEDWENALIYYKKAERFAEAANLHTDLSIIYGNLAETFKNLKLNKKALKYGWKAVNQTDTIDNNQYYKTAMSRIPRFYSELKMHDSVLFYADQILNNLKGNSDLELKIDVLRSKTKALEVLNRPNSALQISKKIIALENSLDSIKKIPKTTQILLENESVTAAKIKRESFIELTKKNRVIFGSIVTVILLLLISYLIYKKNKIDIAVLNEKEKGLSDNLTNVKEQRDYLNRQITSSSANLAIKNDLLFKINEVLEQLLQHQISEGNKNHIKSTQHLISDNLKLNKMWDTFFVHFEKVHPNYMERLKTIYNLSSSELRLCAFLKMNLSYKEIGQLLNVTQSSLHVTVHRLKKKLDLPKEQSVFDFLHSFSIQKR